MLDKTELKIAHHYFLIPMKKLADEEQDFDNDEDAVFVGDLNVMLELSKSLDDESVVAVSGIGGLRCMYFVDLEKQTCEDLVSAAVDTMKNKFDMTLANER